MNTSRNSLRSFSSLALSYALLITLLVPFSVRRAEAAPRAKAIASPTVQKKPKKSGHRPDELLVRFKQDVPDQTKASLLTGKGARKALKGRSLVERVNLSAGSDPETVAAELMSNPAVEIAEPNFLISKDDVTPNDERFSEQWALKNTGANNGTAGADIQANSAWMATTGSASTVIAVIDSGIDFTHPDLQNEQWTNTHERANSIDDDRDGFVDDLHGWDWVSNSAGGNDEQGHGTAIAGIIAAEGNNGIGVSGVLWRARLMNLRILDNTGTGDIASAVEAIDFAVWHGARVINVSWGTDQPSMALQDAIARAGEAGAVVVCSAGNDGADLEAAPYYPASFGLSNVISVASTDNTDALVSWSNYGAQHVTVAAPGVNVLTTLMNGSYGTVSGTSASAPLVTGIVGLLKSQRPWLTVSDAVTAVKNGVRAASPVSGKVSTNGVASAAGALASLTGPNTPPAGWNDGSAAGGSGSGNGTGQTPAPPPIRNGNPRGNNVAPPSTTTGTPGPNLPNLDQARNFQPTAAPIPPVKIHANLPCLDCDPGGGGGGYLPPGDPYYSIPRTFPGNQTGQPGVDLGSRNFNWSIPILSLAGRAGLDLDLGLSYNSLVWTQEDSGIKYNADHGTPGPGFHLGFPTIQPRYNNSVVGSYAYMMVTPSGGRVELRQVGSSNLYVSADGSYLQMTDYGNGNAVVKTNDGAQLSFSTINLDMRCTQIKDSNGNYISINYESTYGHVTSVVDTLGRTIYFNYNADQNLSTITQEWAGRTQIWASFTYGQVYVQPNFPGLTISGPNYSYQSVLTQVWVSDGTTYNFDYTLWGQVWKISKNAPNGTLLSYESYSLPQTSTDPQYDCPRFTEMRVYASDWNSNQEAVTTYGVAGDGSWSQVTTPDGTIHKEFYATSGWQMGLTAASETWVGGVKRRWMTYAWTQDDVNLSYPKNPRPSETNIYDSEGNRKRTTLEYYIHPLANGVIYALPMDIREYSSDGVTQIRHTHKAWDLNPAYTDAGFMPLLHAENVYDGTEQLVKQLAYWYDWQVHLSDMPNGAIPVQHDPSYGTGYTLRKNLVCVTTYDVTDPNNANGTAKENKWGYDITGNMTFTRDQLWHQNIIDYTDSYSDNVNRNTFAYPTQVKDADNYTYKNAYRYDFGAVTRTEAPAPQGQSIGAVQVYDYDEIGRVSRVMTANSSYYHRYLYDTNGIYLHSYTLGVSGSGEAYSVSVLDGAGQVRASAREWPGAAGAYSAQYTNYDVMGRTVNWSKPTEINGQWVPVGDDAAAGFVYTSQTFDWKGRPLVTTNPDGTTRDNTYGGCDCAGGEVTTVRDEASRRKRYTKDVLGRLKTVEELNYDQTVYSTTTYDYNAVDQLTQTNQAGQLRTLGYDGYGRLKTRTTPEQGTTTYSYFADDTVQTVTDARGATTTFAYNNRHLPTSITYGVPAGVAATSNVSFSYDAAGNRTSMTDGQGSVTYVYDQLSRLISETRSFTGLTGSFQLTYGYNQASELTSVTSPSSAQVGYTYDSYGRVTDVTGSGYAGVTSYASGLQYRAFGALKQMAYGNKSLSLEYDSRMRLSKWDLQGMLGYTYEYSNYGENSTGRVTFAHSLYDNTLDRAWHYDQVGRLDAAYTGSEARAMIGTDSWGHPDGPFAQSYQYDQYGNMTQMNGWGAGHAYTSASYLNNRNQAFSYDAAGNELSDGGQSYTYDAAGRQVTSSFGLTNSYDGNGLRAKKVDAGVTTYYVRSSVLGGQVISELNGSGTVQRGYVYTGGQLLALQSNGSVQWVSQEPYSKGQRLTDNMGNWVATVELDPWGADTGRNSNAAFQPHRFTTYERDGNGSDDAMARRYNRYWSRFDQPDPYDGSVNSTDPQSFNRYAYTQNDPVNFTDPTGTMMQMCGLFTTNNEFHQSFVCFGDYLPFFVHEPKMGGGVKPQKPKPTPKPKKGPCDVKPGDNLFGQFFSLPNLALFKSVADQLNTDISFVLAHSAWESHYGDTHARELHNLFGLTHGGGSNQTFNTYQEGAEQYMNILKNTAASGAKTFDDYIKGLKQAGYNSATPGYYDKVKNMLDDVMRHLRECLATM